MRIFMIFFLKMFEYTLGVILRSVFPRKTYRNNFASLPNINKVKYLEKRRQYKGYRKEWLYYRCKEEGLLKEYNQLFKPNAEKLLKTSYQSDNRVKFSFGKYRGKPIEEVWDSDRNYVKWVQRQEWLDEYPEIESEIEYLFLEKE